MPNACLPTRRGRAVGLSRVVLGLIDILWTYDSTADDCQLVHLKILNMFTIRQ